MHDTVTASDRSYIKNEDSKRYFFIMLGKSTTIHYVNINARMKAKIQLKENVNKICSNAVNLGFMGGLL